jgi:hypothetical protein
MTQKGEYKASVKRKKRLPQRGSLNLQVFIPVSGAAGKYRESRNVVIQTVAQPVEAFENPLRNFLVIVMLLLHDAPYFARLGKELNSIPMAHIICV